MTPEDRIAISKKIISIPMEDAVADENKRQLEQLKLEAQKKDNANKSLVDALTTLINPYQSELERYDGNGRTQVTEQDFNDSSVRTIGNYFFPIDSQTPTPSLPNGLWGQFCPFARSMGVGKNYVEAYAVVQKEQDLIDTILAKIALIEAYTGIRRSTGQVGIPSVPGFCSLPAYVDQATCETNGGTWTPPTLESIQTDPVIQTLNTDFKNAVQAWETFMWTTKGLVCTVDSDAGRTVQNNSAKADIDASVIVIDTWQALLDFDTNHGQTTVAGFNAYDPMLLQPTKYRAQELLPLKNEIAARQVFISTRIGQINGYLGTLVQDMNTGAMTGSGFYITRMRLADLRLNLMMGSLVEYNNASMGQSAQDKAKEANVNAGLAYSSVMVATLFRAPAAGTNTIHVMDTTGFTVGNTVYVAADECAEITGTIVSISANMVVLSVKIPEKYTKANNSRLYKTLI